MALLREIVEHKPEVPGTERQHRADEQLAYSCTGTGARYFLPECNLYTPAETRVGNSNPGRWSLEAWWVDSLADSGPLR